MRSVPALKHDTIHEYLHNFTHKNQKNAHVRNTYEGRRDREYSYTRGISETDASASLNFHIMSS